MTEKARAGIYASYAPVGYRNADGADGKRTIVQDPETAPIIADIFERFAAGGHSVKALVKEMNSEGIRLRGRRLQSSVVHQILRKRIYTGDFDWDGTTYGALTSRWLAAKSGSAFRISSMLAPGIARAK